MDTMAARDLHPALERNTHVTCCCCCCCPSKAATEHPTTQHRHVAACSVAELLRNAMAKLGCTACACSHSDQISDQVDSSNKKTLQSKEPFGFPRAPQCTQAPQQFHIALGTTRPSEVVLIHSRFHKRLRRDTRKRKVAPPR
jgi:hypothetical protein